MDVIYNSIKLTVPDDWRILSNQERKSLKLISNKNVECLEVFLTGLNSLVMLQNYGESEGFLESYLNELDAISHKIMKSQKDGIDWTTICQVKPLFYNFGKVKDKEIVLAVMEPKENSEIVVAQAYFALKNKMFCFSYTLDNKNVNFDIFQEDTCTKQVLKIIEGVKENED